MDLAPRITLSDSVGHPQPPLTHGAQHSPLSPIFFDDRVRRETRKERAFFSKVTRATSAYSVNLRKIAKNIQVLVEGIDPLDRSQVADLEQMLRRYSELLRPWARSTATKMLVDVSRRDEKVWKEYTAYLGLNLQREIAEAPTGEVMRELLAEQVALITSLPLDAAQRVHELATGAIYQGDRANEIAAEIMKTGEVTRSRANLIARTEVGRASTAFTKARAVHVGSTHFRWVTSHDYDVRKLHKELDGTVHRWDDPPVAGYLHGAPVKALPGSIWNCRCLAYPLLPEERIANEVNWHATAPNA